MKRSKKNVDPAHEETDAIIEEMSIEIAEIYYESANSMNDKLRKYIKEFEKERKDWEYRVKTGDATNDEFKGWLADQAADVKWYREMIEALTEDLVRSDQIATAIVNDESPYIFALNHDYGTYEIENGLHINTSYTLYNRDAIANLIRNRPDLLPKLEVDVARDTEWFNRKLSSAMVQGILQGEGIPKISDRLKTVFDMGENAAVRTARTAATSAQNAGREQAYRRAKSLGIDVKKQWIATLDSRTRHSHRQLDNEIRDLDERFSNGLMRPGDPNGPGSEVYNCRCSEVAYLEGITDDKVKRFSRLNEISYEDWKNGKNTKEYEEMLKQREEERRERRKNERAGKSR